MHVYVSKHILGACIYLIILGTGGTIAGVGRFLKSVNPAIQVMRMGRVVIEIFFGIGEKLFCASF
jgi:hypothetical protein